MYNHIISAQLDKAIIKASTLHRGQTRKDRLTPYFSHCVAVGFILSRYTKEEEVVIAGILHDTVEDTEYSLDDIKRDFGETVALYVHYVTEPKSEDGQELSWHYRKQYDRDLLLEAPEGALLVRAADSYHNLSSLIDTYRVDKSIIKKFGASIHEKLEHDAKKLNILKERLNSPLVKEYERLYQEALEIFSLV